MCGELMFLTEKLLQTHTNQGPNSEVPGVQKIFGFHIDGQWPAELLLGLERVEPWLLGAGRRRRVVRTNAQSLKLKSTRMKKKEHIMSKESSTIFPAHWIVGTLLFQGIILLFLAFLLFSLSQAVSGDHRQSVSSSI